MSDDQNANDFSEHDRYDEHVEVVQATEAHPAPEPLPAPTAPAEDAAAIEPEPEAVEPAQHELTDDEIEALRADERIGVVVPGDTDGLAALVVRSVGMGDSGIYAGPVVEHVKRLQDDAGLEPTGVVAGATWKLILRPLSAGVAGHEVVILRSLLGLAPSGRFDSEVIEALGADRVNADVWGHLIDGTA